MTQNSCAEVYTERFIIATQDQAIKTNYCRNKILKDGTDLPFKMYG